MGNQRVFRGVGLLVKLNMLRFGSPAIGASDFPQIRFMRVIQTTKVLAFLTLYGAILGQAFSQEKAPELLAAYLPADKVVKGNIIAVLPPEGIKEYVDKVAAAAEADPEWYADFAGNAKPGVPLPFHENLGLTKEQYQKYRQLWSERTHKIIQPIELRLEALGGSWMIRFAAKDVDLTLLRYNAKDDVFDGIGGKMGRIEDVEADPETMLGAWTGQEWKFQKENLLGRTRENFAIGKEKDGKHGLILYRLQNINRKGKFLAYENLLIRFPIEAAK